MKKDFLICIDSDGCAMDTMNIKHKKCFGPVLVKVWELKDYESEILNLWDKVNLYSINRGINRFKGLALVLQEINDKYKEIEGLDELKLWVDSSKELSNRALEEKLKNSNSEALSKALTWSRASNEKIDGLIDEVEAFEFVGEALKKANILADVVVISSANKEALHREWSKENLINEVKAIMSQETGSKSHCIKELLKEGYDAKRILMIGDTSEDLKAAQENGILYYPIMVGKEKECWKQLVEKDIYYFFTDSFKGEYENSLIGNFYDNLAI